MAAPKSVAGNVIIVSPYQKPDFDALTAIKAENPSARLVSGVWKYNDDAKTAQRANRPVFTIRSPRGNAEHSYATDYHMFLNVQRSLFNKRKTANSQTKAATAEESE
jgi:hypothetical protein